MLLKIPFTPCAIFLEVVPPKFHYKISLNEQDTLVVLLPGLFILVSRWRFKDVTNYWSRESASSPPHS